MRLTLTNKTERYPAGRYISENGRWELGVVPVIFGFRVRWGLADNLMTYAGDYCAGSDQDFLVNLLITMIFIFSFLPEDIPESELRKLLPVCQCKPINKDPCWQELKTLAHRLAKEAEKAEVNFGS